MGPDSSPNVSGENELRNQITCSDRDNNGVIQAIGNAGRTWSRPDAVRLIKTGSESFYVQQPGTRPSDVHVYADYYLRTDPDGDARNNLDNLVACRR